MSCTTNGFSDDIRKFIAEYVMKKIDFNIQEKNKTLTIQMESEINYQNKNK